ncbi:MAG: amidohydrolase family protein [Steroidobacteraceae bacterium]
MHDTVIRGGTVYDGTGRRGFTADVAIDQGRVSAVGEITAKAREEVDATGLVVCPGFVDVHTHYDGQVTWENRTSPSVGHGVTTVLMGNCGVGFAPCRPGDRERLVHLMEGIEDIPEIVMAEGIPWTWETYPEYLDVISTKSRDIDVASQLPHSCLRVYVMGERGLRGEAARPEDLEAMKRLTESAMRAGALGFGTSRTLFHKSSDGTQVPTKTAHEDELNAIADGMRAAGHGVMQAIIELLHEEDSLSELRMLGRVARRASCRASYTLVQMPGSSDGWRSALDLTHELNAAGVNIKAQTLCRPSGLLLGLDLSYNPFSRQASYREIADLPLPQKVEAMRDPARRARILSEPPTAEGIAHLHYVTMFDRMFALGDPANYEPDADDSIAARAARRGVSPAALAYDVLLENDGQSILFLAAANYVDGNLDAVGEMLTDSASLWGLGDGGAHYGMVCDGSYSTYLLTHWARDRTQGKRLSVEDVVHGLTQRPAEAIGLLDRGVLAPGYKADINIIDHQRLHLHPPSAVRDLPSNGRRLVQRVEGYVATLVNGVAIERDGKPTASLPGRLVRGPQPPPAI